MAFSQSTMDTLGGLDTGRQGLVDFRSALSAEGLARRARELSKTQIGYDRYTSDLAMTGAYRMGVGAQQAALGAQGVAGGSTARLFSLQSQLELQSAASARDMALLQRSSQANVNLAAAGDTMIAGIGNAVTKMAKGAVTMWAAGA